MNETQKLPRSDSQQFNAWMFLYFLVAMVGWIGLILLIHDNRCNPNVVKTMDGISTTIVAVGLTRISGWLLGQSSRHSSFYLVLLQYIYWIGIHVPEYNDFAIGVASGNFVGVPIIDNAAIYWGYVAADALAMAIL